jgi:hypothetical protein
MKSETKASFNHTTYKAQGGKDMKRLAFMLIIVLIVLGITNNPLNAFSFTEAYIPTAPVAEPIQMILLGTGFIALGIFGRRILHK